jgi:IS5 family transposase
VPQSDQTIAFQSSLVADLPRIQGSKDFTAYRNLIERVDELLRVSNIETEFIRTHVDSVLEIKRQKLSDPEAVLTEPELQRSAKFASQAMRCNLAGVLLSEPLRGLSLRIAESSVLQRFCLVWDLEKIKVPSKSLLCAYRNVFPVEMVQSAIDSLTKAATSSKNPLQLSDPLEAQDVYIDCTCLEGNIHFPVDWLLLRDGVRTIIKAILVIRKHGLLHRMPKPESFLKQINRLCIEMHNCRRKKGAKKLRKRAFRRLKQICKIVEAHGQRYVDLLTKNYDEQTDLCEAEAKLIIKRLNNVLTQLPAARKQAHQRIITEKQVKNEEKILSLYDSNVAVIKRGKSNAEVEFGNELYLAEQKDGLIIDWMLYADQPPADSSKLPDALARLQQKDLPIKSICSDRGFFSGPNDKLLQSHEIVSKLCPRDPAALAAAMQDEAFRKGQRRRSQTEARVGIVKNCFTGNPVASRIFEYRERYVGWAILTHNMWVIARLPQATQSALAETG